MGNVKMIKSWHETADWTLLLLTFGNSDGAKLKSAEHWNQFDWWSPSDIVLVKPGAWARRWIGLDGWFNMHDHQDLLCIKN